MARGKARRDVPAACLVRLPWPISGAAVLSGRTASGSHMSWLYLFLAGLAETGWAIGLKYTDGFTRLWPSVFTGLGMALSFMLLSIAIRTLPVGTAYAIWTGIGATGTALLGMWLFAEPATTARFACLGLIIIGMVGLKVVSPA